MRPIVSERISQCAFSGLSARFFAAGAAAPFLGKWIAMMRAMTPPNSVPMLLRYGRAPGGTRETRPGRLTAFAAVINFFVWTVIGLTAVPLGIALAATEKQQPALARTVPIGQVGSSCWPAFSSITAWDARHLAWCRERPEGGGTLPADAATAFIAADAEPVRRRSF